jgi:hypothetical protein
MRPFALTALLLVAAASVSAQDKFPVVLMEVGDASGARIQFGTDTDALARTPEWKPGTQEPPIAVTAATRIAIEAAKRRLPKASDIAVDSITLRKSESYGQNGTGSGKLVRWYYVFSISPIVGRDAVQSTPGTTIVILLDGSVIEPSVMK